MPGPLLQIQVRIALTDHLPVLSVSGPAGEILGFSPDDLLSGSVRIRERIHPHDADIADALFCARPENGSGVCSLRLRHADGRIRCLRVQYTKKLAQNGAVPVLELILQDVRSLWQHEDTPAILAEITPVTAVLDSFIYFKNRDHVYTGANSRMLKVLTEFAPDGAGPLGVTDYDLFPEDYADVYYQIDRHVLAGTPVAKETTAFLSRAGDKLWIDNHKYPVRGSDGNVLGLVGVARDITKRIEGVEHLRTSEEQLREAQSIAGLGSYELNIQSGIWTSSAILDWIFGIDQAFERTTANWLNLLHPEDRASMGAYFTQAVVGNGQPFNKEYRIVRSSDGTVRWVHGMGRLEFDAEGSPVRMLGTIQDITERKLTELALRETRDVLQLFIEHAPAALAMFDKNMCYLAASRRWLQTYKLESRSVRGRSHYELIPEIPEKWKDAHRRGLAGENLKADDDRFERSDGTVQRVQWEIIPWRSGDGSVDGIIIFAEDVSKQKQVEEQLRLAASVFTHAHEGITITDAKGTILEVNDSFTRITGYSREEAVGQNPRILKSGLQGPDFYARMWQDLKTAGRWSGEIWNRAKSGEIYPEMLTISAMHDDEDSPKQYVALFTDITEIKERERQLERIVHYDVLTGLPNRVLLADRLQQALTHAARHKKMLAVASLDLDQFKKVNESYGQSAGDNLLIKMAKRLSRALREDDVLAHTGGDEFVFVLFDLENIQASKAVTAKVMEAVAKTVRMEDITFQVTASMGITFYPQPEDVDADQLLRQADQALYQAKLTGRNRVCHYDPSHDLSVRSAHENLERIRRGMAAGEFALYYQPKVNMRNGKMIGAEALIRWQHPDRGLLPPGMFLPVINNHPMAIEVGEWVIDTALAQMEAWLAAGLEIPVSVNVDAVQLQHPDFVQRLREQLAAHPGVPCSMLQIEVLESSALQDLAQTSQVLRACGELGVSSALDDFGAGYSSLSYLKHLPASTLKIDRSFVSDMLDDPEDLAILEGVLRLASAFRRHVIAEGVETLDHGLMLLQIGCEEVQGFGIARPMPADDLPGWMASWHPDCRWASVPAANNSIQPLLNAGVEHKAWAAAFEAFLQGKRATSPLVEDHRCRFGRWLEDEAYVGHLTLPAYRAVDEAHRQFHALAAEIHALHASGLKQEGLTRIVDFHAKRDILLAHLDTLRNACLTSLRAGFYSVN